MGKITFTLPDDIEERFREAVKSRLGTGKGALSLAATQAIKKWLSREGKREA